MRDKTIRISSEGLDVGAMMAKAKSKGSKYFGGLFGEHFPSWRCSK